MKKKLQKLLKNQKGLTLIELLAVVVILGIIAAIAVPSIANIIDNSKKDAHVANAEQLIGAARLAVAANDKDIIEDNIITLKELITNGYIESDLKDPDTDGYYNQTEALVEVIRLGTANVTYKVTLKGQERGIYAVKASNLDRKSVKNDDNSKANNETETSGNNGGSTDSGSTDGGSTDGGSTDGGSTDGGSTDGGSTDGGSTDGSNTDTGEGKQYKYDKNYKMPDVKELTIPGDAYFERINGGIQGFTSFHISGNATFKIIKGAIHNSNLYIDGNATFGTIDGEINKSKICVGGTVTGISGKSNQVFSPSIDKEKYIANCPAF